MPDADLITAINAELAKSGVYVDPALASVYTPAIVAQLRAEVKESRIPLKVVIYNFDYDDEFGGDPQELITQLHDAAGTPGAYLSARQPIDPEYFRIESLAWDVPEVEDFYLNQILEHEALAGPAQGFVRGVELVASEQVEITYRALPQPTSTSSTEPPPDSDGGGFPLNTPTVLIGLVALGALGIALTRRRPKPKPAVIPAAVVDRMREAHDVRLRARADRDRLDLGELIDQTDLTDTHNPATWQLVLDCYDAAGRLLAPEAPDILDVHGAIVLCEIGTDALAYAASGAQAPYRPRRRCYFNPLHTGSFTEKVVTQEGTGTRAKVPVCSKCARDLEADRRPDLLDVVISGAPVHYFDSAVEPWASTGFGALIGPGETSLVERLHQLPR